MDDNNERRIEQRLRYHWPVWFAEDFGGVLGQGQMVDVSSGGAAFTCNANNQCPYPGQHITTRFSVPNLEEGDEFDMTNYTRHAHVCRVEHVNDFLRRVAVQFAEPLPFQPGEQADSDAEAQQRLKAVVI